MELGCLARRYLVSLELVLPVWTPLELAKDRLRAHRTVSPVIDRRLLLTTGHSKFSGKIILAALVVLRANCISCATLTVHLKGS